MEETCRTIQYLGTDGFDLIRESSDCNSHQTARKLLADVEKSVVLIETGETPYPRPRQDAHVGTGFFVNDGDEVVTNAHVAIIDAYVDIIANDGKKYKTKVVKLDDDNDLALLKVIGIDKDPDRALKPEAKTLKKGDELYAFGHPGGSDDVIVSPGTFLNQKPLKEQVGADLDRFPDLEKLIESGKQSSDPVYKREVEDYLNSQRLHARMNIRHANSGSPMLDDQGKLQGVVANRLSAAHALMIPAEKLDAFLKSKPEFSFDYESDSNQNLRLRHIKRTDGSKAPPVVLNEADK